MAENWGTFVVYEVTTKKPLCVKLLEADARGEVHELNMYVRDIQNEQTTEKIERYYDYVEVPLKIKTAYTLSTQGKDIRRLISDFTNEEFEILDLYCDVFEIQ